MNVTAHYASRLGRMSYLEIKIYNGFGERLGVRECTESIRATIEELLDELEAVKGEMASQVLGYANWLDGRSWVRVEPGDTPVRFSYVSLLGWMLRELSSPWSPVRHYCCIMVHREGYCGLPADVDELIDALCELEARRCGALAQVHR